MGFGLSLATPEILEITSGWDFFFLDNQHGQYTYDSLLNCVRVSDLMGVPPVIRVPGDDYSQIGPALDTASAGVIVPMIHTAEQAQAVVQAAKFPPLGQRSTGGRRVNDRFGRPYVNIANDDVLLIGQIESVAGFTNAEQIAATEGMDSLMFGPFDYGLDSRVPIQAIVDMSDSRLWDAAEEVAQACKKHHKIAFTIAFSVEHAKRMASLGYQMIVTGFEVALLKSAAANHLSQLRQALQDG